MKSFAAIPFGRISRNPDVATAFGMLILAFMLIVPIPGSVLDLLIPLNLLLSVVLLASAVLTKKTLDLSSFPSFLLITTLFRLALNLSSTRGILAHANAGDLVAAFGAFVVRGDLVIGFVMFVVITLVQFLVISKGAERVAEVGARFTLDAMPGKQMSIDAAVRNGAISEEEGQAKREDLSRASTLLGSLDGAMKFVKGDAIAGLVITVINLIGGLAIGVTRNSMTAGEAAQVYGTLTIGDALVAQVAALIVTLAAGLLVTRVEPKDETHSVGHVFKAELFENSKVLWVSAVAMAVLALVPGLPMLPFAVAAVVAAVLAGGRTFLPAPPKDERASFEDAMKRQIEVAKKQKSKSDHFAPTVVPIGVDLGAGLSAALGFGDPERDAEQPLIATFIPQLRDALYFETGVRFPGVRVRPNVRGVADHAFVVRIDDVPVLEERLTPDTCLATATPEQLSKLGVKAEPRQHPISAAPMGLIPAANRSLLEASGVHVWDAAGIVALHLASVLKKRASLFLGVQEVADLIEQLERAYPALVKEVVPRITSLPQLLSILRRLVDEGVSIRNLRRIIEALGEHGTKDGDPLFLTERVRSALGTQLAYSYAGLGNSLPVVLLDPIIEDTVRNSISVTHDGHTLAIDPELAKDMVQSMLGALEPMLARGKRPIILTESAIRRYVKKLVEIDLPSVAVVSFDELPPELSIQPMGRAMLPG